MSSRFPPSHDESCFHPINPTAGRSPTVLGHTAEATEAEAESLGPRAKAQNQSIKDHDQDPRFKAQGREKKPKCSPFFPPQKLCVDFFMLELVEMFPDD